MSRKLARTNPALAATAPVLPSSGGEGLNKLFGTSADFPELVELDLDQVHPNPDQPRRHFDEASLRELADSLKTQGQLQPILVKRRAEGGYVIAAGERRWRALGLLGKPTVFAIVTKGELDEVALVENLQRQDLDVMEMAFGILRLAQRHKYTQEQIGAAVGMNKSEISRLLALAAVGIPDKVREEYPQYRDRISKSHMYLIADCQSFAGRLALWDRIKAGATIKELREVNKAPKDLVRKAPFIRAMDGFAKAFDALVPGDLSREDKEKLHRLKQRIDILLQD